MGRKRAGRVRERERESMNVLDICRYLFRNKVLDGFKQTAWKLLFPSGLFKTICIFINGLL